MMLPTPFSDTARQHYLDAMGIDVWLPIQPLAGAAPSPEWVWGELPRVETEGEGTETERNVPMSARVSEADVSQVSVPAVLTEHKNVDVIAPRELLTVAIAEPSQSTPAASYSAPPRFRLAMVAYDDALVISQLPMDVLQSLAPEHQALMHRILQSIGLGAGSGRTQLFAWPIVNNPNVDQSMPLAQAAVKSLASRLDADSLPLLVFGHQLIEYLGLPEQVSVTNVVVDNRAVIAGPTLNELISVPGFKRDLWVRLQAFQSSL